MRVFIFTPLLVSTLFFLADAKGPGQEKKNPPTDPLGNFEPKKSAGTGQKFLEKFVGDWSVVKTFHPQKGDPVRVEGDCRQFMIHDGKFLQSDFSFKSEAGKTTGMGLIGFEADSGLFTSIWTDSRQTRMSLRRSEEKFNGHEITLVSKEIGEKETRRSRTVTKLEEEGKRIVHRQFSIAEGKPDRVVMELVLTKKLPSNK